MGRNRNFKDKSFKKFNNKNFKQHSKPFNNKNKKPFPWKKDNNSHPKEYSPRNNLKENQVGITEYVSEGPAFTGVIKARFSDFHVNEIDLDGREVKLTDQSVPVAKEDALGAELLASNKKELENIVTDEIWSNIESIIKDSSKDNNESVKIDVTDLDKEKRTLIHKTLKEQFGGSLVSTTATIGERKFIQCSKSKGNGHNKRNKWLWPGEYVYFVVHKENVDTVQAASDLAQNLRLKPSAVNYAGTKDKRAKTTQRFCVKKREPEQIKRAAKQFHYMQIGNFEFKETVLKLGQLKGNRFRIVLRLVTEENDKIEQILNNVKENGFINYYGLQRFGNSAVIPTHKVGIALLKGDYKLAAELILKPRDGDMFFMKEVREFWWKTRNSAEAAAMFTKDKFIEKKLLDGLATFGENDYANALRRIPRNMLLLYTHAYQSLVWNKVASRRIKTFGLKVIPGDLVYNQPQEDVEEALIDPVDASALEYGEEEETDGKPEETTESPFKTKVRALTDEDISSGKYSIFDILLPLPGYDITYPSNEVGKWYEEILLEDDLQSDKLKHNVKTYSLAGAYRKVINKLGNMKWEFKRYNSPTSTLIASDLEEIRGIEADADIPDGKSKALLLDFELPSSSYATMALREILKSDTSAEHQAKINEEELLKQKNSLTGDQTTSNAENGESLGIKRKNDEDVEIDYKKTKEE